MVELRRRKIALPLHWYAGNDRCATDMHPEAAASIASARPIDGPGSTGLAWWRKAGDRLSASSRIITHMHDEAAFIRNITIRRIEHGLELS
jgi:hypothetical protein